MKDDLIESLLLAETDFLDALQNGPQIPASYRQRLSTLPTAVSAARKTGKAGAEALSLAHTIASRISRIASCFLDIQRGVDSSTAQLRRDCDVMLRQMATLDLNPSSKLLQPDDGDDTRISRSCSNTSTSNVESSPPFLAAAHQWLLDNLHNPYPTGEVKAQMATTSSCQVSSINSWFINVRRRIGWTALCRERFSNCRADMIDAAYRALVEEDLHRTLSPELRHSFVAIKVAAEGLYSSTLTRSAFAEDLDVTVTDMTEEDRKLVVTEKLGQVDKVVKLQVVRNSYPSPDPSSISSPVPALSDSLTDEDDEDGSEEREDIAPPIIAGSKRRWSSIEPADGPSSATSRPIKRLRASATSQMCLPSPPSSMDGIDIPPDDSSLEYSSEQTLPAETVQVLTPRARCPFDASVTGRPQNQSGSLASPRFHTVSDHLPHSHIENEYSIDDWFNTNFNALFNIPPPVDATAPDLSVPWEVELFKDYSIPGDAKYAPECPPAPMVETVPAPDDLSDLDSLLQSICSDSFAPPLNILPTNITGDYPVSLDSSLPDISQTNLDWMSLLHGAESYQPTVYSTFPQYPTDFQPLPEIDLSMLQLPHVIPAVNTPSDFASKKAKLHQLHSMQEAVRRMEQELRFEGVVV